MRDRSVKITAVFGTVHKPELGSGLPKKTGSVSERISFTQLRNLNEKLFGWLR